MKKRIAVLGATLFTVLAMGVSAPNAAQLDQEKYFTVTGVDLYEVIDGHEVFVDRQPLSTWPTVGSNKGDDPKPTPSPEPIPTMVPVPTDAKGSTLPTGTSIGDIITIGEKIWDIIEKNRPVVIQNYAAVSAVPPGIKSWDELQGWSEPTVRIYKLVYTNTYKMKVVEFEYRVAYTTNGNLDGVGRYLSRVEVEPKTLNVAWGYKFNASGMVLNVTNAGTRESPLAAMELSLNWSVESVTKHMGESVRYYIRGDGLFKDLSGGTMTPDSLK